MDPPETVSYIGYAIRHGCAYRLSYMSFRKDSKVPFHWKLASFVIADVAVSFE